VNKKLSEPLISVRTGEDFDWENLRQYLIQQKLIAKDTVMELKQFLSGSSNLTYLIRCGEWEGVMSRPSFGTLPPKANDMKRESILLKKYMVTLNQFLSHMSFVKTCGLSGLHFM
jgi:hypothetical protein